MYRLASVENQSTPPCSGLKQPACMRLVSTGQRLGGPQLGALMRLQVSEGLCSGDGLVVLTGVLGPLASHHVTNELGLVCMVAAGFRGMSGSAQGLVSPRLVSVGHSRSQAQPRLVDSSSSEEELQRQILGRREVVAIFVIFSLLSSVIL